MKKSHHNSEDWSRNKYQITTLSSLQFEHNVVFNAEARQALVAPPSAQDYLKSPCGIPSR